MNKIELKGIDETVIHETLSNGLEIYLLPNKNINNFYITFSTKFGSAINNFRTSNSAKYKELPSGVAHFLEHTTFYMEDMDASDYFASLGSFSNAYTSFNVTCYEVFASSNFKENLNYLLDFVQTPYYNESQVKNEKGIIIEEVKMYDDMPESLAVFKLLENMFHTSEYRNKIAGTVEDVKKISLNDILSCYNTFYHPSNMFVIITGNFNPEEAISIIHENQSNKKFTKQPKIDIKNIHEKTSVVKEKETIKANVETDKVSIGIKVPLKSFKSLNITDTERNVYISMILNSMFGRSSELKDRLVRGNIITDGIYVDTIPTDEYIVINLVSETPYKERYISLIKDAIENIQISEEELQRKIKVAISNLFLSLNDIELTSLNMQEDILNYGDIIPNYYDIYKGLKIKDAIKVCNIIKSSPISILVLTKES